MIYLLNIPHKFILFFFIGLLSVDMCSEKGYILLSFCQINKHQSLWLSQYFPNYRLCTLSFSSRCSQRDRCERANEPYRFAATLNQCVKATVYPDSIAVSEPSVPVRPFITFTHKNTNTLTTSRLC